MTRIAGAALGLIFLAGCNRSPKPPAPAAKAFGAAIAEVGGSKQVAGIGAPLDQPVVVQVNDAQGTAVAGALVEFHTAGGATAVPDIGLTGADGQFTTTVTLGGSADRYRVVAVTRQDGQARGTPAGRNRSRLSTTAWTRPERLLLRALSRSGIHSGTRLQSRQSDGQAARFHGRSPAERDERCAFGFHRRPRRSSLE